MNLLWQELGVAGQAFLVLEEQAREGYMRADALVNCIQGIKLVRRTFFKDGNISEYPDPMVPLSADIVDKMEFFVGLVDLFRHVLQDRVCECQPQVRRLRRNLRLEIKKSTEFVESLLILVQEPL